MHSVPSLRMELLVAILSLSYVALRHSISLTA
jgi:hypothetical protein